MLFRALFLKTIRPSTWFEDVLARFGVVGVTKLVYQIEQYVGYNNIMYIAFVLANALVLESFELWLVFTSYVHYIRYITTYYNRDNIAYEDFKRDVLLFKSIALGNLAYVYLSPFDFDISRVLNEVNPQCLVMIVVGYALSMKATKALGLDRTYFGVELGFLEPKWIHEFPYGTIPHPMIVSQVLALYGLYDSAHVKNGPYGDWLLPVHMVLYLIHMTQEIYDVHCSEIHGFTPLDDKELKNGHHDGRQNGKKKMKKNGSPKQGRDKSPAPRKTRGWSPGPRRGRPAKVRRGVGY